MMAGNGGAKRACCKVLQHALSEERKEKSEEKMCPFGTLFELFT